MGQRKLQTALNLQGTKAHAEADPALNQKFAFAVDVTTDIDANNAKEIERGFVYPKFEDVVFKGYFTVKFTLERQHEQLAIQAKAERITCDGCQLVASAIRSNIRL